MRCLLASDAEVVHCVDDTGFVLCRLGVPMLADNQSFVALSTLGINGLEELTLLQSDAVSTAVHGIEQCAGGAQSLSQLVNVIP